MSNSKRIAVKMLKKWGRRVPGDIVMFDPRKGLPLIAQGFGELHKLSTAKVETAMTKPITEIADNPPKLPAGITSRPATKAEEKAKAKTVAKAKAKKKGG